MPTSRRHLVLYGVLAAAAAAVIVFGLNDVYGYLNSSAGASGSQRTATVAQGIVQASVSASGNVGVATSAAVNFVTSGTLTRVEATVGEKVKVGQPLAAIDPTSAQDALMSAKANLQQAQSTLSSSQAGLTASEQASNTVSLQQAQSTITTDEQQLASDETTLAAAKAQVATDESLSCPAPTASGSGASAASGSGSSSSVGSSGSSSANASSLAAGGSTSTSSNAGSVGTSNGAAANGVSNGTSSNGTLTSGASSSGRSNSAAGNAGSVGASTSTSSSNSSSTTSSGTSTTGTSSSNGAAGNAGSTSSSNGGGTQGAGGNGSPASTTPAGGAPVAGVRNGALVVDRATIAAVAPTVTTGSASGVTSSGATLGGTVNPGGEDTTYDFIYGTSPSSLTSTSSTFDAGSSSGSVPVAVPVSGLHASQNYYFELVATNGSGTTDGNLGLFTTSGGTTTTTTQSTVPVASTGQASSVTATSATLGGTVNPEGIDTSYYFVYGTSPTSLGSQTTTLDAGSGSGQVTASAPVSGLAAGQTYYYALVATNSSGSTTGSTQLFTTGALAFATTGQASSVAATTATFGGSVTPGGLDTTYHFEYGTSATAMTSVTPTLDAGTGAGAVPVSVPVSGLKAGTTYYFALSATNSSGTATGAPALLTTATLSLATTGEASSIGSTAASLAGSVTPGGLATSYWFEYGTSPTAMGSRTAVRTAGSASTGSVPVSVTVNGLKPALSYYFRLVASNASGSSDGALGLFTTGASAAATTGQASSIGSTTATLGGTVTPGGLATSYWFEYGPSASQLRSRTARFAAGAGVDAIPVSAAVTGLKVSQSYVFRLVASNAAGVSDGALSLFTTGGPSVTATTGSASAVGSTTASFSGSVDPGGLPATYKFEYGKTASNLDSATSARAAGSGSGSVAVSATITGLKPDTSYMFRLVATNSSGSGEGVEEPFTTTAAGAPVVLTGSSSSVLTSNMSLDGSVNPTGSDTKYWFEYGTTGAYGQRTPVVDAGAGTSATEVTATVKGLKADTEYLFRLVARNAFGTTVGIGTTVRTSQTSCATDAQTVTSDEQTVEHAQAALAQARESLVQTEATIAASSTPSAPTVASDRAAVVQDEATVSDDEKAVAETTLTAPVAGVITAVDGTVGQSVSGTGTTVSTAAQSSSSSTSSSGLGAGSGSGSSGSSSALVSIDSLNQLEIVAGFAEADATKIAVGQPATITFPALPDTEVAGRVIAVSSTSSVVSNVVTYNETIALVNPPSAVKEGMTADVSVIDQTASNVLYLPSSAITTTGTRSTVELLQNGQTTVTPVVTGLVGNSTTEIVSGLKSGDVVVEPTVTISAATSSTSTGLGGGGLGLGGGGGFAGLGGGGGGFARGG